MKLKLFRKQLKNVHIYNFYSCGFLHKVGSVSVPFPSVLAIEMIDSLAENFKPEPGNISELVRFANNFVLLYVRGMWTVALETKVN